MTARSGLTVERLRVAGHDVAFESPTCSITMLLGRPGGHTSVVLEAIAGIHRSDGAKVLLNGEPITPQQVGTMQHPARLFPELTAAENVAIPLLARSTPADTVFVEGALGALALAPATWHNLVEQLSGGQQQRVAIARALVTASPLVCLDEPVTELDEASVDVVWSSLRMTASHGAVIVIATTDRDLAERGDQIVRL